MNEHGRRWLIGGGVWMLMATLPLAAQTPAGTAFSYQGRLTDGGAPASGLYDLRFTLFDAATGAGTIGSPVVVDDATVTSGLFTVLLDFGASAFSGDARWLEIAVRPGASTGDFTPLASRQMVTPSPHTVFSQSAAVSAAAPWTGITGKPAGFADDVDNDTLTTLACSTAGFVAKWTGSAWSCALDADATGLDWKLTGNAGTGGAAVLGTTDNQPFTVVVNNKPTLRITDYASAPAIIAGHSANTGAFDGATIAGGGLAGIAANVVLGIFGTVGGGIRNHAGQASVVGGGTGNLATGDRATIAGGDGNQATDLVATISGGFNNKATALGATVGGGTNLEAIGVSATVSGGASQRASGEGATISGGLGNTAAGRVAVIPGGEQNFAEGWASLAAGFKARAEHDGTFVWGDTSTPILVNSTGVNQFIVRAAGGIWLGTNTLVDIPAGVFLNTSTGAYLSDGGTWTNASDRNVKEGFEPIDGARLLDQVARLPITSWSYKASPGVRHIGPMAQDFQSIFGVGDSDKAISTIDPAGIALATIQELHRQNAAQDAEIKALRAALQDVLRQLQALTPGSNR